MRDGDHYGKAALKDKQNRMASDDGSNLLLLFTRSLNFSENEQNTRTFTRDIRLYRYAWKRYYAVLHVWHATHHIIQISIETILCNRMNFNKKLTKSGQHMLQQKGHTTWNIWILEVSDIIYNIVNVNILLAVIKSFPPLVGHLTH